MNLMHNLRDMQIDQLHQEQLKRALDISGIENAISIQEFATLYNLASEWNENNDSEKIEINCIGGNGFTSFSTNINIKNNVEKFMSNLGDDILKHYVIFIIPVDAYSKDTGRISKLNFTLR